MTKKAFVKHLLAETSVGVLVAAWCGLVLWGGSVVWDQLSNDGGPFAMAVRMMALFMTGSLMLIPVMIAAEWSVGREMDMKKKKVHPKPLPASSP